MTDKPWDLRDRSMRFAVDVYRFCRTLPGSSEAQHIVQQLRRSASSVAANYRASRRGKSDKDFATKLGTVIEEADESLFWLEFLVEIEIVTLAQVTALKTEANELVAIFTACQMTARKNIEQRRVEARKRKRSNRNTSA